MNPLTPTPEQIKRARGLSGLSQDQCAALVHIADSAHWRKWESGRSKMPPATWELFLIKTRQRRVPAFGKPDPSTARLKRPQ